MSGLRLWMPCIGLDCGRNPNSESEFSYWSHSVCNTDTYIEESGMINCKNDGCNDYFLLDAWFRCEKHDNYKKADINNVFTYLGAMGHTAARAHGKEDYDFYKKLQQNIMARSKEYMWFLFFDKHSFTLYYHLLIWSIRINNLEHRLLVLERYAKSLKSHKMLLFLARYKNRQGLRKTKSNFSRGSPNWLSLSHRQLVTSKEKWRIFLNSSIKNKRCGTRMKFRLGLLIWITSCRF